MPLLPARVVVVNCPGATLAATILFATASPTSFSLFHVLRPTTPSAVRQNCFWNDYTLFSVASSKVPVTAGLPKDG